MAKKLTPADNSLSRSLCLSLHLHSSSLLPNVERHNADICGPEDQDDTEAQEKLTVYVTRRSQKQSGMPL